MAQPAPILLATALTATLALLAVPANAKDSAAPNGKEKCYGVAKGTCEKDGGKTTYARPK